jgi:hypothetical protein
MEPIAGVYHSSKEIIIMPLPNGLQKVAIAGQIWRQQEDERLELERQRQEQVRLETERNSPQALAERDRQMMQASADQAIIKQEALRRAALDKAQREKAERVEEIVLLGKVIAEELKPMFSAQTAAIEKLVSTLKED